MKSLLEQLLFAAIGKLVGTLLPEMPDAAVAIVERSREPTHGQFASSVAMRLARAARQSPHDVAEAIVATLPASPLISRVEIAGNGFINFFLRPDAYAGAIRRIHELGDAYGRSSVGAGRRVTVGSVSQSRNGLPDVSEGRQAIYLAALVRVLAAAGYEVHRDAAPDTRAVQGVTLCRGTERADITTLRRLCDEVGEDTCHFFFLARAREQTLDLDVRLATLRASENPAYFVQYAHARAGSLMKEAKARELSFDLAEGLDALALLDKETEQALIAELARFPEVVQEAATNCAPHAIVYYLREVATAFHNYYDAETWIVPETTLRNARLALVFAARQVLRNGLGLLGVSAPESM